jgi:RNA polymerase sigma factor (TIGR02999 family)
MSEVTRILQTIGAGDAHSTEQLLPLVYDELRRLATARLAAERPGQTLSATSLVHEAYLRLVGNEPLAWDSRGHFFAAAAEAMRRIVIERARAKATQKRGGGIERLDVDDLSLADDGRPEEFLRLDEALTRLEQHDAQAASLVKLRFFGGLSHQEAAAALGISRSAADRQWTLARAWLYRQLAD